MEEEKYEPRLKIRYEEEVVPDLIEKFSYRNKLEVPALQKIVVNMGVGEAVTSPKEIEAAARDIALITGQKPLMIRAKKSVASFRLRAGMKVGCKVTLRRARMYEFLDRLLSIGLPRIRDFRGLNPKSFDGHGNYSLGIEEQLTFPEIDYDKIDKIRGMDITIVTTARSDEEAKVLLDYLGFPFKAI
ncbi:MAG: 50S ribosomal protein L5 [Actinomycetota bacterium]|nr:50S ribosomal protein L5 [Actinomycetota bacterium]